MRSDSASDDGPESNVVNLDLFGREQSREKPSDVVPISRLSASTLLGRYAEFMVCAYLTKLGHNVLHVDASGFDLILEYDGCSYRVDVKSTDNIYRGPFKESAKWACTKGYWIEGEVAKTRRAITPNDTDLMALFHRSFDSVVFYPVIKAIHEVRLPLSFVRNSGAGKESLEVAIKKLMKSRGQGGYPEN